MDYFSGIEGPGPSLSGKWLNKNTGGTVFVRDNVMSDSGMSVILSDGRMIDLEVFSRDYVQYDDLDESSIPQESAPIDAFQPAIDESLLFDGIKPNTKAPEISPIDEFGDLDLINNLSNIPEVNTPIAVKKETVKAKRSDNYDTIDKLFSKVNTEPEINISIDWDDYPNKEVSMLINFLDIDRSEIAQYLYDKYFNKEIIIEAISEKFIG